MAGDKVARPKEGWYRNVSVRMWGDERFRRLSNDAKFLWLYLLTGPHTTALPGLFAASKAHIAEELAWEPETFDRHFL